jgi:hypothetical protein
VWPLAILDLVAVDLDGRWDSVAENENPDSESEDENSGSVPKDRDLKLADAEA